MTSSVARRCLLLALCACPLAHASPVASTLSAVVVYADRAVVTRTATVTAAGPGPFTLTFEKLPETLLDNSLQVAGLGDTSVTILDVTPHATYVPFTPDERTRALEDTLRTLREQQHANRDQRQLQKDQEQVLTRIEGAALPRPTRDEPVFSLESATKLLTFLATQRAQILEEERRLDQSDADLQRQVAAAEQQLAALHAGGPRAFKTITVTLAAAAAGTFQVRLSYTVPGASWQPSFDARVAASGGDVQLGYFGLVRQHTGEDWTDVDLTLSTARPALGGAAPELSPWFVDLAAPPVEPGMDVQRLQPFAVAAPRDPGTLSSDLAGTRLENPIAFDFAKATASALPTSATFHLAVRATVASDNSAQKVPITTLALTCSPHYRAVPKALAAAFLTDHVVNASDYPLLAGPMNVFIDQTFIASSWLPTVMPGAPFDLALGADEGISLERTLNRQYTESVGVVTKKKRVTYEYTLAITNRKRTAVTLVVQDQVPVSRNAKIAVKVTAPDAAEVTPAADGTLTWNLTLQPSEKLALPLRFSIDYPEEIQVAGLN